MERLTIKYNDCYLPKKLCTFNRFGEICGCTGCVEHCEKQLTIDERCPGCAIQDCFDRLGAYEDTGLDPEQLSVIDEEYSKIAKELAEFRKMFMETEHEPVLRLSEGRKISKYQWKCPMCYSQVGLRIVRDGNIEDKDIKRTCPKCGWNIDWERVINGEWHDYDQRR